MQSSYLLILILIISVVSFILFGIDKQKAIKQQYRISENVLLGVTLFGGTIGTLIAMKYFRHKTSKRSFKIKLGLVIGLQLLLLVSQFQKID